MGIVAMKKVSVIMPMYNVEKVMARSVQSLFSQTLRDFEAVFVDDCSSDNTGEELKRIISGYDRDDISVKIVRHEPNKGVAAARNAGLDNAEGEYVYYLDSDDYFDDDALEVMYESAKRDDADVVDMLMKKFGLNGRTVPPVLESDVIEFEKFCVWLSKEADMLAFREYFKDVFHFIDRGDDMFEIVPLGISKATGIQGFIEHYQIPLENCYALGDSTNDLDMLKFVPHSIAMGHCMEEILPYCEYQTDRVEEDGLEKALKHYGII